MKQYISEKFLTQILKCTCLDVFFESVFHQKVLLSVEPDDFFRKKVSEVASHKAFEHTLKIKDK